VPEGKRLHPDLPLSLKLPTALQALTSSAWSSFLHFAHLERPHVPVASVALRQWSLTADMKTLQWYVKIRISYYFY
jgi:hypothetical protein